MIECEHQHKKGTEMKIFFWKLKYAYLIWLRIRPTIKALWLNASDAWDDNRGASSPGEAVSAVLDWEGSARQWNAEVDAKKRAKGKKV